MINKVLTMIILSLLVGCSLSRPSNTELYSKPLNVPVYSTTQPSINILCISGGAANGSFGAGVINGWRDEPDFQVVSGISTGSLLSVFAFIDDPKYSDQIKEAYTTLKPKSILDPIPLTMIIFNNSISKSDHLKNLIDKYITNDIIDRVTEESLNGRLLVVGTTDLDRGQFRQWDMSQIAKAKDYNKFRQVLLASCSIPIAFSPQFIDGSPQSDGGITKNVFCPEIYPENTQKNIWIIYNGRPNSLGNWQIKNSLGDIASRSISILSDQGYQKAIMDIRMKPMSIIHYAQVPDDTPLVGFDFTKEQLIRLYESGYKFGKENKWQN